MKINKKSKKLNILKKIIIIAIVSSLLFGLAFVILEKLQITDPINQPKTIELTNDQTVINTDPPTTDQRAAGELQKETNNALTNNDLGISITSINTSNDQVQIRSVVSGAISNNGICTINLTKGDLIVSKTSETYALPSSSTCKGFDINKTELSAGEWQIKLTVNIEDKESSITDSFNLE